MALYFLNKAQKFRLILMSLPAESFPNIAGHFGHSELSNGIVASQFGQIPMGFWSGCSAEGNVLGVADEEFGFRSRAF